MGHNQSLERWEQMCIAVGHLHVTLISFLLDSSSTGDPSSLQGSLAPDCSSPGWGVCPTDPAGLNFSKKNECFPFLDVLGKQSKTDLQKPH